MKSGAGRKDVGKQRRRNEAQNTGGRNAVWAQGKEKRKGTRYIRAWGGCGEKSKDEGEL